MALRDASSLYANTAAVAIPKPAILDGDTVVLFACLRADRTIVTPPSGFAQEFAVNSGGTTSSHLQVVCYTKYVANASLEPTTYDLTWSAVPFGDHFAVTLSGRSQFDPIDVFATLVDSSADASVSSPDAITTGDGCDVLRLAAMTRDGGFASGTWAPTDATELEDPGTAVNSGRKIGAALAYESQASAGATGTEAWTVTAASFELAIGVTVAVTPPVLIADAGGDQSATPGELILLDGSNSLNATSWTWTQTLGTPDVSDFLVPGPNPEEARFYAPEGPGSLTFQLEVGDGVGTKTDTCVVTLGEAGLGAPLIPKVNDGGVWV
jgi:hypothetical protein